MRTYIQTLHTHMHALHATCNTYMHYIHTRTYMHGIHTQMHILHYMHACMHTLHAHMHAYIYIYIYLFIYLRALRASRPRDLDICKISIANLLDDVVLLFFQGRQLSRSARHFFEIFIAIERTHGVLVQLSGMRNFSGTLNFIHFFMLIAKTERPPIFFSEVLLALVKFTYFFGVLLSHAAFQ